MVKGQLLGIPNWIKNKIDELTSRVGNNENAIGQINGDIALNKQTLGYECKNLIPYPYHHGNSRTTYGITFNVSDDGVITANGTNTGEEVSDFYFTNISNFVLTPGEYRMTYDNSIDENTAKCTVGLYDGTTWVRALSNSDGGTFTITEEEYANGCTVHIYARVYKGKTVSNLTFKPMLRRAEITDDTYEVYKPSVDTRITKLDSDIAKKHGEYLDSGNLNAMMAGGSYIINGYANTWQNLPSVTGGGLHSLEVLKSNVNDIVTQIFTDVNGRVFYRRYEGGKWYDWISGTAKLTHTDNLDTVDAQYEIIRTDTDAVGYPTGLGGNSCSVIQQGWSNYRAQLAFGFGGDKLAIRRKFNSDTWSTWKYITFS